MPQRFFVDTNVFYSKTLMDWLFPLKQENNTMFQLHATEDVFAEVALNMQKSTRACQDISSAVEWN
ncbi:MAG: hypothetical protein L0K41_06205 [Yaniella sp.]|uniref:hypothetical protein n=1 Tax=Yaniella sp. TaxID=2773929 RepID=UPI0026471E86|nr:hypothetical protein [Yaniella sp.]MDN5732141.1 hypothetical protein [Yaniella sp.]MDN5742199.1 hypothetical protein [Yaniella sp.]MDN5818655.1 hypothetical protein [Yaniella sp.]MDN5913103.1 hypothetical protein [Yaniella sp.]MDN6149312.1 hypothetical protein [Yaniella sp.]